MAESKKFDAELIIADSDKDPNMLYATGLFVPDPFIYIRTSRGQPAVVMSDLEYSRALKHGKVKRVYSLSKVKEEMGEPLEKAGDSHPLADVVTHLLKKTNAVYVAVPENFPIRLADLLRKRYLIQYRKEPFFKGRAVKKDWEVECIRKSLRVTEKGFAAALKILQDASIGDNGKLYYHGKILRAEDLRAVINSTIASNGYSISHTIVACGQQAADPHNEGSGPLKANQTIVVDIFPRSDQTGYYGDFTRTVVKGKADETVKKAYRLVREAQDIAFGMIAHGMNGKKVHLAVQKHFETNGFPKTEKNGRKEGFIHGTGHGLGLALHEYPSISETPVTLKAGNTVTVEPGLYYRKMGGIRLEDVVVVTKDGCENLTRFPKSLEIE